MESELFRSLAEVSQGSGAMLGLVGVGTGVAVVEGAAKDAVDEEGDLARGRGDGLGLADAVGDAAIEGSERGWVSSIA